MGGCLILNELVQKISLTGFLAGVLWGSFLCFGILSGQKKYAVGSGGFLVVTAAAAVLLWNRFLVGGCLYWNKMADTLGSRSGIYLAKYEIASGNNRAEQLLILIFLGVEAGLAGIA